MRKFWITLLANTVLVGGTLTATIASGPAAGAATTSVYVSPTGSDANTGTASSPFRTISRAARSAVPGTTVHVAPGNYPGALTTTASGTSTARIKYVSDTKWGAKITSTGQDYVWENKGNYVDIDGFDISSSDARIGIGNSSNIGYVNILNNHVHNLSGAACTSNGGAAILQDYWFGAKNSDTIGNVVDHIGPSSNCSTVQGIYHSMSGGKIQNNIVHHVSGFAIHFWHAATNATASNNLVFSNYGGGITVGDGDAPGGIVADNFVVSNNIVMDNPTGILEFQYSGDNAIGNNNKYIKNLVYRNGTNFRLIKGQQSGTLSVDPQMVNYQTSGSGDYHLKSTSPAIDAGTTSGAPTDDFDGRARPSGSGVDIGPFEFGGTATSTTSSTSTTSTTSGTSTTSTTSGTSTTSTTSGTSATSGTSTTGGTPLRVNTGGGSYTDAGGHVWSADTGFSGTSRTSSTSASIANTTDDPLYRNERYGKTFGYTFGLPNGTYSVTLKFAENYWTAAGKRKFNVDLNGTRVLSSFDIYAAAGAKNKAVDKTFTATVTNGTLNIAFTTGLDNAKIDAIQIVPA